MRFKIALLVLLAALLATLPAGCGETTLQSPTTSLTLSPSPALKDISVEDAYALIRERQGSPDFIIIDVRTPAEFAEGHIKGARLIDFTAETFRTEVGKLDRSLTYLIYCQMGVRSATALAVMTELGFMKVYNMSGGITDWKAAGFPTEK